MKPEVSVMIPTFNRRNVLRRAVGSVLAQTFRDFELIVVDDGSTDGTQKIVGAYCSPKSVAEPVLNALDESALFVAGNTPLHAGVKHLQFIRQKHRGVSSARNAGIRRACAELIAFLDSDDEWLPEKLERQVQFFRDHPKSKIVQTEEIWIRNGRRVNPMKKHKKYGGRIFKHCLPLCIVSPSAVMMKRELFDEVGLFDESLPACEDYDLWLRIACRYPIDLIDEPLIIKYGGYADQLSRTIPTLDRYRIQSLVKILSEDERDCPDFGLDFSAVSGIAKPPRFDWNRGQGLSLSRLSQPVTTLSKQQFRLALRELKRKCRIYGEGCLKRGRKKEAEEILNLPAKFSSSKKALH